MQQVSGVSFSADIERCRPPPAPEGIESEQRLNSYQQLSTGDNYGI
jgi:hypothetical protein